MLYKFNGKRPVIGKTTYVSETATIIGDVLIGDNCYIGPGAVVLGDLGRIEIGNETAVEDGVSIHAPPDQVCSIGDGVILGHGAIIHGKVIHDSTVIGMGAVLSINSEIGRGSVVAEGAIVKQGQKIPEQVVVAGNPAKKIREVSERELELENEGKQMYVDLANKYRRDGLEKVI